MMYVGGEVGVAPLVGWAQVRTGGKELEGRVRSFAVTGLEKWDGG